MNQDPSGSKVTIRREIEASAEELFDAWLDPASLAVWMRPHGIVRTHAKVTPIEGGALEILLYTPEGPLVHTGVYRVIDRPRRLVFTWISPATKHQESLVTVDFRPGLRTTEVVITHERLPDEEAGPSHTGGWSRALELLGQQFTAHTARGPLVVSKANPRYFTVGSDTSAGGRVVYLTGSHINNNFHDGMGPGADCAESPEQFDYYGYLKFLKHHRHNFIRLWRWELFRSQLGGGKFHGCMSPQPWPRTGPGTASDGKPKFDLSRFDETYFGRLRDYVVAAGNESIYVSVMLFDGHALHLTPPPDNVKGHPFHATNNINDIGISSIVDYQVLPLNPRVQQLQEAYIRKVVDTVHDLANVLYEVANESSGDTADSVKLPDGTLIKTPIGNSTEWQYWVIDFVKRYEHQREYDQHPIGMTMQYPVPDQRKVNDPLFKSAADWISPGFDEPTATVKKGEGPPPGRWLTDPPVSDGAKVIISDTDHYSPFKSDPLWAWRSFLRGHNPILYDFGIVNGVYPSDPSSGTPSYESGEPTRHAMGDTRLFAQRIGLMAMVPRGDLSSTGYALANAGQEYLVLAPGDTDDPFTVTLTGGTYLVQWYSVNTRENAGVDQVTVDGRAATIFRAPFASKGPAVLYLRMAER